VLPVEPYGSVFNNLFSEEITMSWMKPEYTDMRFGFEVTMYIAAR
jgi:coenzyme PQQ precursor peptide PqqA